MGVVSAILRFAGVNVLNMEWQNSAAAQGIALIAYICIIVYMILKCLQIKKVEEE